MLSLSETDLKNLILSVFSPGANDKKLVIIVDVPDDQVPDRPKWQQRRVMAQDWKQKLTAIKSEIGLEEIELLYYLNVHNNNADLPETAYKFTGSSENIDASTLSASGEPVNFLNQLSDANIVIAPTQFSATAPLKILAKKYGFRAATMPGFSADMIQALKLDYEEINQRVKKIKNFLDQSVKLDIKFKLENNETYDVHFDLRHRTAHASGGRFPKPGVAGNLPSGESYIVPYEGEKEEKSESFGILPVQYDDEIVLYQIEENVATKILSQGKFSEIESQKLKKEPAYGNIAEIGFGVLKDFGVKPTGEILLDEKLGLHIAFGRSDHFGGNVGVADFTSPENVVHIDRIYIPETQPKISAEKVELTFADGKTFTLMVQGKYTIFEK